MRDITEAYRWQDRRYEAARRDTNRRNLRPCRSGVKGWRGPYRARC